MIIKGNGGEGKSQIGAVLNSLLGSNMKDGSIGKISETALPELTLEYILLCVDDMRMEALKQMTMWEVHCYCSGEMDLERRKAKLPGLAFFQTACIQQWRFTGIV